MTEEHELLNEIAIAARRLFPSTWDEMFTPAYAGRWVRVDVKAWADLGVKLLRLEDMRVVR